MINIDCQHIIEGMTWWQLLIAGLLALAFLVQMFWWLRYFTGIFRYNRRFNKNRVKFNYEFPPVSVIICAKDEEHNLRNNLPVIMNQLYPEYEVIVVNDASYDNTEELLAEMKLKYPNLKSTYVPEKAKFIDSKKFALSLGIKAAQNEILVFTDADCTPASNDWLGNIVRNFDDGTDIVIGYGAYAKKPTLLNMFQVFDTMFIGMQYLNYSLAGKTYMGVGRNMAYRKSMFIKSKGFTSHLNLQSGDDDLFINEVATSDNTKIEIQPVSQTISEPKSTFNMWMRQKRRHLSTSGHYKASTKFMIGTELAFRTIFYVTFILSFVFGNCLIWALALLLFLIRYLTQYIIINKTATQLSERHYYFGIVAMDTLIPCINLCVSLKNLLSHGSSYKWK
ncbi:MAG: glycosyltransferase [Paludibacteraceae bacterium]|nr:glycosyltransferase [Paludibacteraceae bacterium]